MRELCVCKLAEGILVKTPTLRQITQWAAEMAVTDLGKSQLCRYSQDCTTQKKMQTKNQIILQEMDFQKHTIEHSEADEMPSAVGCDCVENESSHPPSDLSGPQTLSEINALKTFRSSK